ncbi:MAG TPA: hypothetical protein VMF69_24085 [Gemmataceae bacterium]|nr:hypothetical protein [Gemmataceae bacterium]
MADYWPQGVFQDASEETTRPLAAVLAEEAELKSREFFVYQDEASAVSWAACGKTAENANRMIHFLIQHDSVAAEKLQITIVIDEWDADMIRMYASIEERLVSCPLAGPPGGPSVRLNFDAELRAVGCPLNREQFYEAVEHIRKAIYPEWTQDELAYHPHDALRFCEIVRSNVQAPVPDHLVMKAMLNYRKRRAN